MPRRRVITCRASSISSMRWSRSSSVASTGCSAGCKFAGMCSLARRWKHEADDDGTWMPNAFRCHARGRRVSSARARARHDCAASTGPPGLRTSDGAPRPSTRERPPPGEPATRIASIGFAIAGDWLLLHPSRVKDHDLVAELAGSRWSTQNELGASLDHDPLPGDPVELAPQRLTSRGESAAGRHTTLRVHGAAVALRCQGQGRWSTLGQVR